ncbi:hypothetical protein Gogos_019072 [Gossypium gossypioides]|uniref:Uncharacterized protein n=1 Tax=Gossypium gossypioides TaxID=34282 RepID=A0A7J9BG90_GOSGO|nr:hypothetical protein [Gossypium gossypioides]
MLESGFYYKDVLDYWGQQYKDYQIFALFDEEWINVAILCKFLKVFYDVTCVFTCSNYAMTNLYLEGFTRNSKSTSSSLAESSNVSDNDIVDSSLYQLNVNRTDLGGDYD